MRLYELTFIASPDLPESDLNALLEQIQGYINQTGAEIEKFEKLGRQRLAYEINHQREGFYVLATLRARGSEIGEIERRLRVTDVILRFMTVRVDRDYQRAERMAAVRKQRLSRKAASGASRESAQAELPIGAPTNDRE